MIEGDTHQKIGQFYRAELGVFHIKVNIRGAFCEREKILSLN